jgi:hypothetical protein
LRLSHSIVNLPTYARSAYLSCSFVIFPNSDIVGFCIIPIPWHHNLRRKQECAIVSNYPNQLISDKWANNF